MQNNYYRYPALIPPMPWIDIAVPPRPVIALDTTAITVFTDSIKILIRQDTAAAEVNRYILYSFADTSSINASDPKAIVTIMSSMENYLNYSLLNIPLYQKHVIIAATSVTRYNNESSLSRYINMERRAGKWVVISTRGDD